jgi:hypothetical protein
MGFQKILLERDSKATNKDTGLWPTKTYSKPATWKLEFIIVQNNIDQRKTVELVTQKSMHNV